MILKSGICFKGKIVEYSLILNDVIGFKGKDCRVLIDTKERYMFERKKKIVDYLLMLRNVRSFRGKDCRIFTDTKDRYMVQRKRLYNID